MSGRQLFESPRQAIVVAILSLAAIAVSWGIVSATPDYAEAQRQVAELSPGERDRLMRNYERYRALDAQERRRLVALEKSVEADPDSAGLKQTMEGYYAWLKNLSPGQRADLQRLDATARIKKIQELYQGDLDKQVERDDWIQLVGWLENRALARLPEDERARVAARPPLERRILVIQRSSRDSERFLEDLTQSEVDELTASLRGDLGNRLRKARNLREARMVLFGRMFELPRKMASDPDSLFSGEAVLENQQALKEFFENELPDEERDQLLSLPPDEMLRNLRREYFRQAFPEMFSDRRRPDNFVSPERGRDGGRRPDDERRRNRPNDRPNPPSDRSRNGGENRGSI